MFVASIMFSFWCLRGKPGKAHHEEMISWEWIQNRGEQNQEEQDQERGREGEIWSEETIWSSIFSFAWSQAYSGLDWDNTLIYLKLDSSHLQLKKTWLIQFLTWLSLQISLCVRVWVPWQWRKERPQVTNLNSTLPWVRAVWLLVSSPGDLLWDPIA